MKKRGEKIIGILFLISVVLILSLSIISASILTDIQGFFNDFFKDKEKVSTTGELLSSNPINVNTADSCPCGTKRCNDGIETTCTNTHPCYWYYSGTCTSGPVCGDGTCSRAETCSSCPSDCGSCGPRCGDGTCSGAETCSSCPSDCGSCSCTNECTSATCAGTGAYKPCGNYDSDSCLEYGPVTSCGTGQTCSNGVCGGGCTSESNSAFCTRLGKNCGSVTALDNCGISRTANCGTCTSGTCADNVCAASCTASNCPAPKVCYQGSCCTKKNCIVEFNTNMFCGVMDDGCGGTMTCPTDCTPFGANWECDLRQVPNKCCYQNCPTGQNVCGPDNCGNPNGCGICNDNKKCTDDTCVSGTCSFTLISCDVGKLCNPSSGQCYTPCNAETCRTDNQCKIATCNSIHSNCAMTNKKDGAKCTLSSSTSSLSSVSPLSSFLRLFGVELAMAESNQGTCQKGECVECTAQTAEKKCPADKTELVCKNNGIYERKTTHRCVEGKCTPNIVSDILKQDCNDKYTASYNCKCVHDAPFNRPDDKDYYSVCTLTKVIGGECLEKYPGSNDINPHCYLNYDYVDEWIRCGSTTSLGITFSNCDDNVHSPDFGHCKDTCNPACDSQCQYCFTWVGEPTCYNLADEKTCRLPNDGGYGQCKSGKCELSKCNPVPRECQFCGHSKTKKKYIAAADPRKDGMDCTDDGAFSKGTAFCKNGECVLKNCQNIGGNIKCGTGTDWSSPKTCCNSKTETCCGNKNSAFCCNKDTEICDSAYNVNGYNKRQENFKAAIKYMNVIKYEYNSDPSKITYDQWFLIWKRVLAYYNQKEKNTIYNDINDFYNFCAPKENVCNKQGKQVCEGTHGSSCCPKKGQGSTCITYQILDPAWAPNIEELLKEVPEGTIKVLLRDEFKKNIPTYGLCGDATCPMDTTQCFGNSFNIFNQGVLCCKNDEETCNPSPTSWDGKDSIYPFPVEMIKVTQFPPRCEPAIYCGAGYTTCKLTETSIADNIFHSKKLCCKIGSEVCFSEPSLSYIRCVPLK